MRRISIIFTLLLFVGIAGGSQAESPKLDGRVSDLAGVLLDKDKGDLTHMLKAYEAETCHQIVILTVKTTNGESIDQFSLSTAKRWGIGYKNINNGVLVTLAVKDRRARIEVGLGLEKYISDEMAAEILQSKMIPEFKKGNYAVGLSKGIISIMSAARYFVVPNGQRPNVCKRA